MYKLLLWFRFEGNIMNKKKAFNLCKKAIQKYKNYFSIMIIKIKAFAFESEP